mmetsp:Transcript_110191/g.190873  ORF Transcript_110191/g.190873 Transcript_110191/m.190873 type:complete len:128 (-) Transcript_110191:323-706(-)
MWPTVQAGLCMGVDMCVWMRGCMYECWCTHWCACMCTRACVHRCAQICVARSMCKQTSIFGPCSLYFVPCALCTCARATCPTGALPHAHVASARVACNLGNSAMPHVCAKASLTHVQVPMQHKIPPC